MRSCTSMGPIIAFCSIKLQFLFRYILEYDSRQLTEWNNILVNIHFKFFSCKRTLKLLLSLDDVKAVCPGMRNQSLNSYTVFTYSVNEASSLFTIFPEGVRDPLSISWKILYLVKVCLIYSYDEKPEAMYYYTTLYLCTWDTPFMGNTFKVGEKVGVSGKLKLKQGPAPPLSSKFLTIP